MSYTVTRKEVDNVFSLFNNYFPEWDPGPKQIEWFIDQVKMVPTSWFIKTGHWFLKRDRKECPRIEDVLYSTLLGITEKPFSVLQAEEERR